MPAPPTEENLRTDLKTSADQLLTLHKKFHDAMNRKGGADTAGAREAEDRIKDTYAEVCLIVHDLAGLRPDMANLKAVADELEQLHPAPSSIKRIVRAAELIEAILARREASGEERSPTPRHEKTEAEMAEADGVSDVPVAVVAEEGSRRERGPDLEKCRERVKLEDKLRGELALIVARKKKYVTLGQLRSDTPDFELWKVISSKQEQEELLGEKFSPKAYARSLVARKHAVTVDAIKKSRAKLKAPSK